MPIKISRNLRLPETEYLQEQYRKDLVVLHHTVGGSAHSTFTWWKTDRNSKGLPRRIATAYIVERDGTILEVFPPECWAYHLGLKRTRGAVDKRSIGIELASEGPLLHRAGNFYAFGRLSERTLFSGEVYDNHFAYREQYRYFAAYTNPQIQATAVLVDMLIRRWGIPRVMPRNSFKADFEKYRAYKGVLGHAHLRTDKTDPHPGFPWDSLACHCDLKRTP